MKKDYSFNQKSQYPIGYHQCQNRITKQNKDSWTDLRVVEIKKKYDTPSHRKIGSNCLVNQKNKDIQQDLQKNSASYRNTLRESIELPSVMRRQSNLSANSHLQFQKQQNFQRRNQKRNWQQGEYIPNFNYGNKQNTNITDKKNELKINKDNKNFNQLILSNKICPRVQYIDKLNIKIKKALDTPHYNYSKSYTIQKGIQQHQPKSICMDRSSLSRGGNLDDPFQQAPIVSRQKFLNDRENSKGRVLPQTNKKYSLDLQVNHEPRQKWKFQQKYGKSKNSQTFLHQNIHEQPAQQVDNWLDQSEKKQKKLLKRRKSCRQTEKHSGIQLHSGKKLNDEILKITTRIKQFQQQKKKLNIQFIPFIDKININKQINILSQSNQQNHHRISINKYINKGLQDISNNINKFNFHFQQHGEQQHYQNQFAKNNKQNGNFNTFQKINNTFFNINNQLQFKQKEGICSFQQKQSQSKYQSIPLESSQNACSSSLQQKMEEGIQQRKRKLLDTATVTFSRETKKLISNLFEQVKLDQELRNAKIWFRDLDNCNKFEQLRIQAEKSGVQISQSESKVTQQQDNPFYSVIGSQQSFNHLISCYLSADNYWHQNIKNNYNIHQFQQQKFTSQKVDLQKKGYFVVQDLVRFLNMQTGTFYRNRDLILIFRRLSNTNKLLWEDFLNILTRHN